MRITIIGAGALGKALFTCLTPSHEITFWDTNPKLIAETMSCQNALTGADIIFLCIPSSGFSTALEEIKTYCPRAIIVSLTKGIEPTSGDMLNVFIEKKFSADQYALLCGPMIAQEINEGRGAIAVVASQNIHIFEQLNTIFFPALLRLQHTTETRTVAIAGVLKNVYTLMIGILDGLGYGNNLKGFFAANIIYEFKTNAQLLELDEQILLGTAGIADFLATCFSPYSKNFLAGRQIGQSVSPSHSEGLTSLPYILAMFPDHNLPKILQLLQDIIIKNNNPRIIVESFLSEL